LTTELLAFVDASSRTSEHLLDPSPDYLNDNTVSEYS